MRIPVEGLPGLMQGRLTMAHCGGVFIEVICTQKYIHTHVCVHIYV